MLRTQLTTSTTGSKRTSRRWAPVGMTMLTSGCSRSFGLRWSTPGSAASISTSAGSPVRSQCACTARLPASKAHGFAEAAEAAEVSSRRQW